jgi:tetratricopeptide (TPR) repeat protein
VKLLHLLAILLFLAFHTCFAGAESESAFEKANQLFEQGKFSEATAAYEALLNSGQKSPAIYFNVGNSLFKSGQLGHAIAAYRKAEQLAPRDPDIAANLKFARGQVQGPSLSPNRWQRWLGRLSLNEWTLMAAGGVWLWLMLLTIQQCRPALRPQLRGYFVPVTLVMIALCAAFASALYEDCLVRSAVVVARDAAVHQTPFEESQTAFTLSDGAEVRVLDREKDWLQVSPDSRRFGWLRRDRVVEFGR